MTSSLTNFAAYTLELDGICLYIMCLSGDITGQISVKSLIDAETWRN